MLFRSIMGGQTLINLARNFRIEGNPVTCELYGNGHINTTYKVDCDTGHEYIIQKLNTNTFKDPHMLMDNLAAITSHLKMKTDNHREVLSLVKAESGASHVIDDMGGFWRAFEFVTDSVCLERAETVDDFYESAVAFGRFQNMLIDFPTHTLGETIPDFHDTEKRYAAFKEAVAQDKLGRVAGIQDEIDFVLEREPFASIFMDHIKAGEVPLRVTHNDAKLNNVLFDKDTRKGVCVIDLDTVMPGVVMNDFGDAIRFGASTAAEDEKDLRKVEMSLELFAAFVKGFLSTCGDNLTQLEIDLLPTGAKMMTLECGIRFLGDYIAGDTYFSIHYPEQNLDRFRTHLKLVSDMESKWDQMHEIVQRECE